MYSNPGTLVASAGVRTFPLKGHEITGWYVYRAMTHSGLLETAFAPEIQAGVIRQIRKATVPRTWGVLDVDPQSAL